MLLWASVLQPKFWSADDMSPGCDGKMFITSRETCFQKAKNNWNRASEYFFPGLHCWRICASHKQASRGHPSFLYSCHCSGVSHSRAAEISASDCCHLLLSFWYKGAAVPVTVYVLVPYLPSAKAAAVPWDIQGFSSENLRSRIRVKAWLYPMIPSGLSHSYPPPTQENNLVPLCFANARISWQSDLSVQSNAIKCPTTDFGDCYKGWWNHAFIFRDFKCTNLCVEWREHWWQAGSKRRIAGKQSGTVLEC